MPIGEIGAFLLFLVIVFIVGNLWFHFVEAILRQIKSYLHVTKTSGMASAPPGQGGLKCSI